MTETTPGSDGTPAAWLERGDHTVVYPWHILPEGATIGAPAGISQERQRAIDAMCRALRENPRGGRGIVQRALLTQFEPHYRYKETICTATIDPATGAISMEM